MTSFGETKNGTFHHFFSKYIYAFPSQRRPYNINTAKIFELVMYAYADKIVS